MGLPEVDFNDPNWRNVAYIKGVNDATLKHPATGVTQQYDWGYTSRQPLPEPQQLPKPLLPRDSYRK